MRARVPLALALAVLAAPVGACAGQFDAQLTKAADWAFTKEGLYNPGMKLWESPWKRYYGLDWGGWYSGTVNALRTVIPLATYGYLQDHEIVWGQDDKGNPVKINPKREWESIKSQVIAWVILQKDVDNGWGFSWYSAGRRHEGSSVGETAKVVGQVLLPALIDLGMEKVRWRGYELDVRKAIADGVEFLLKNQITEEDVRAKKLNEAFVGGWPVKKVEALEPDPYYTAVALSALCRVVQYWDYVRPDAYHPELTKRRVLEAIRRGVEYLLRTQEKQGDVAGAWKSWTGYAMGDWYAYGVVQFCLNALLDAYAIADELGLDKGRLAEAIKRAFNYLFGERTVKPEQLREKYAQRAGFTTEIKVPNCGWIDVNGVKVPVWAWGACNLWKVENGRLKGPYPDLTETPEIYLAILKATRLGVAVDTLKRALKAKNPNLPEDRIIDEVLKAYARWVAGQQLQTGGWPYRPGGKRPSQWAWTYCTWLLLAMDHPEWLLKHRPKVGKVGPTTKTTTKTGQETKREKSAKGRPKVPVTAVSLAALAVLPALRRR